MKEIGTPIEAVMFAHTLTDPNDLQAFVNAWVHGDDLSEWPDYKPKGDEPERAAPGADGSVRKAHYGDGRQPWDDTVDSGWGPAFSAGNVLKYLRRTKTPEANGWKARWYYDQLIRHAAEEVNGPWTQALGQLEELLTSDELKSVRAVSV